MSRPASVSKSLPALARDALLVLGENLRVARERRREPLREWASRIVVSVPTLQRMERGNPSVGMGVYAAALCLYGQAQWLAELANPSRDVTPQKLDIAWAARRRR